MSSFKGGMFETIPSSRFVDRGHQSLTCQVLKRLIGVDQRVVRSVVPQFHPVAVAVEVLNTNSSKLQ